MPLEFHEITESAVVDGRLYVQTADAFFEVHDDGSYRRVYLNPENPEEFRRYLDQCEIAHREYMDKVRGSEPQGE